MPVAHLKRPTAMRIMGSTTHCDAAPFAGSRKATRGKAGVLEDEEESRLLMPKLELLRELSSLFFLLRGLCELEAIVTGVIWIVTSCNLPR